MNICKIINCLKNEIDEKRLKKSDFVEFMDNANSPYIVLIACILSLRTNDKTTIKATKNMLKIAKTPQEMAKIDPKILEHAIYPVGFYKRKAVQIIELSKILTEKYSGIVPNSIDELLKFKGVGRKTANLVLAVGYSIPAICVDVHVDRICNRIGYVNTKTPAETEFALREILPKKYWLSINTILVTFGQNLCKPINPKCEICPIKKDCKTYLNQN